MPLDTLTRRSRAFQTGAVSLLLCAAALHLAPGGAAQATVDGCTDAMYLDRTGPGADRAFNWTFSFSNDPERCIQVRVGQTVTWQGNLEDHPLEADEGDTPNPIGAHQNGVVTFDRVGVFGYRCTFHLAMRGAVKVVAAGATGTPVPALGGSSLLWLASLGGALATWILTTRRR